MRQHGVLRPRRLILRQARGQAEEPEQRRVHEEVEAAVQHHARAREARDGVRRVVVSRREEFVDELP